MVKRVVVGAHYGLRDWLTQRVTAVVILLFTLFLLGAVALQPSLDYASWKSIWSNSVARLAALLAFAGLLLHAWIGVRNVFMDYIKPTGLRLTLQVLVILALLFYGAWSVQILWST
jgi:succinate dehydrogenase / fumarate reductase membrane anchor subunit